MFRDETQSTQRRVLAQQAWVHVSRPSVLEQGWDTRAPCIFITDYVLGFSRSLGPVTSLHAKASAFGTLSASLEATSLAFIADQLHAPTLLQLANTSYVTAIQKLRQALSECPNSQVEEILQSIILLDMYEKMLHRNPQGSPSWMSHAEGAMSLTKAHAEQLASTSAGRQLGARLMTSLTVSCGAMAVRVPSALAGLRRLLDPYMSGAKWQFSGILAEIVNLQADLRDSKDGDLPGLTKRAEELDGLLFNLQSTMPPSWRARRISSISPHPLVFGTYYEVFSDHFVTQVNNGIRVARLIVNKIMLPKCWIQTPNAHDSNKIALKISEITQGICATVPQFLLQNTQASSPVPFTSLQRLQCRMLLAPLYMAHQVSSDVRMKDWIYNCLLFIAVRGDMKLAQDIADLMKNSPQLDYWFVYAMVGCYAFGA
ncbi:hypothetical protein HJFPF1_09757 [Paramyrothecium foliicola]|nr:hypothetical protein HJFPF1_09757 [Paramyrothecium foliicola]